MKSENTTVPKVLDERLELSLFAEDPDIVTPIGIGIDSLDRIYVLESHTHTPPADYPGPAGDVIKVFQDQNGDGKPDHISVYAEGFEGGMNMAFSPDGVLYLVTTRAVWALSDHNGDGSSDEQVKVLELTKPESVYPHSALLGITFSHDDWMYISRGNLGGFEWKLTGTDGSSVSGYGDGGNIVRARPDGTELEEVTTGFWNPVDVKFDEQGRLFAADNDPDSRGPNRLVHIIPGGDYGYKSFYGGSGIHPYLAWDGELPGTLPYAAGLGEAPSGLLKANLSALPEDYRGEMLCTIWEESRIVRIRFSPKGVSVTGETEPVIEGDQDFRPVAFATDSEGSIYFTDWVLRYYPNHGRGKIWKLSSKPGIDVMDPTPKEEMYAKPLPDSGLENLDKIYTAHSPSDFDLLRDSLASEDPFIRHAAVETISDTVFRQKLVQASKDRNPEVRLGVSVALHRSGYQDSAPIIRRLLSDPDIRVRQHALKWAGRAGMSDLRTELDRALTAGPVTTELFETYLATVRHLMPRFIEDYQTRVDPSSRISRTLPPRFIESFIRDTSIPEELRALAVKYLENPEEKLDLLHSLLDDETNLQLRIEVIRSLASISNSETANRLSTIATDRSNPVILREETLLALAWQSSANVSADVIPLLRDPHSEIQMEAARYLRTRLSEERVREALRERYATIDLENERPLQEQIVLALSRKELSEPLSDRPTSVSEWQKDVASGGNPERGHRVFFSTHSACSSCHIAAGRGGDLGPDLTNVGQSKTRDQIVRAILRPSEEINPEWQGWFVRLKNGEMYQGRQINVETNAIDLYIEHEGFMSFDRVEVEDYGMIETSLMPEGLEASLTVRDMRDLIAWLIRENK